MIKQNKTQKNTMLKPQKQNNDLININKNIYLRPKTKRYTWMSWIN